MPGKRHSEEQILYALREVEAGKKVSEVCREMGVSQQAGY
jgi:transposase-like protein